MRSHSFPRRRSRCTPILAAMSLPLYLFEQKLQAPVVVVPIANHDDNQHAPDENLRIGNLWYGISLYATLMTMPSGRSAVSEPARLTPGG